MRTTYLWLFTPIKSTREDLAMAIDGRMIAMEEGLDNVSRRKFQGEGERAVLGDAL